MIPEKCFQSEGIESEMGRERDQPPQSPTVCACSRLFPQVFYSGVMSPRKAKGH